MMRTNCPECGSNIEVRNPGTNPAAPAACDVCGSVVRPGAFCCPHCEAGLQVNRTLLPAEGGMGRCPACQGRVHVPPLSTPEPVRAPSAAMRPAPVSPPAAPEPGWSATEDPASTTRMETARVHALAGGGASFAGEISSPDAEEERTVPRGPRLSMADLDDDLPEVEAVPLAVEEADEPEEEISTKRLDVAALVDDVPDATPDSPPPPPEPEPEATTDPGSTLKMPSPTPRPLRPSAAPRSHTSVASRPAPTPAPARKRRGRGLGLLVGLVLGGGLSGGAAWAVGTMQLYQLPPFPFPELTIPEPFAWPALLGAAGAIVGALLGGLLAGRR